jgi:hypothetical protein
LKNAIKERLSSNFDKSNSRVSRISSITFGHALK